jgi:regulator of protease activity HflC (stomatin/prohibitin superfamily)
MKRTLVSALVIATAIIALFILVFAAGVKSYKEQDRRITERVGQEQRENEEAIKQHHALIGMTAAQVRQAWGEPKRIIRTIDERHTYEEWIYGRNGSASLYFIDDVFKSGTRTDGR